VGALGAALDLRVNRWENGLSVAFRVTRRILSDPGVRLCLGVLLVVRLAVIGIGEQATRAATPTGVGVQDVALELAQTKPFWWLQRRWDAQAYFDICVDGYSSAPHLPAFFPAFPVAMCVAGQVVAIPAWLADDAEWWGSDSMGRLYLGGTIVSLMSFALAVIGALTLARLDLPEKQARWAVILIGSGPFAYFFGAAYTESLFLAALTWAFVGARRGHWGVLAATGMLVGLTRHVGFLASVPLLMTVLSHGTGLPAATRWRMGCAAFSPVIGMSVFSAYLWWLNGDPFAWVTAQQLWSPVDRWAHMVGAGLMYPVQFPYEAANTTMVLVAMALVPATFRLNRAYGILSTLFVGVPLAMGVVPLGRLCSVVFPLWFALASRISRFRTFILLVLACLALQALAASLFYSWRALY
jgi:hypothetical protein